MKTTKELSDQIEEEYYKDKSYILAEQYHNEMLIWQEIEKEEKNEQKPSIILGKGRKSRKFETHAKVRTTRKIPRFISRKERIPFSF